MDVTIDLSATGDPSQSIPGDSPLSQNSLGKAFKLTLAEGTVNTLKGGYLAAGLRSPHTNGLLTITGKGRLDAYGGYTAAGIGGGGGEGGDCQNVTISGGTVRAVAKEGCNSIGGGNGSETGAVTPVNSAGKKVHLMVMENAADATVTVDENPYSHKNHKAADIFETTPLSANASLYLYLTEEHHTIQLGETTQCYHWANGQFSPCTVSDTLAHNDYFHWNACTEPTCTGKHNLQRHVQSICKSDDTQFWRECVCGYINPDLPKKDKPLFLITGADRVCRGQDYVFTITLGEGLVLDDTSCGCSFTGSEQESYYFDVTPTGNPGEYTVTIPASKYQSSTGMTLEVSTYYAEGDFFFDQSKTVTILANHVGENGVCQVCGQALPTGGDSSSSDGNASNGGSNNGTSSDNSGSSAPADGDTSPATGDPFSMAWVTLVCAGASALLLSLRGKAQRANDR